MDEETIAEADRKLAKIKRLHREALQFDKKRAAKIEERNELILELDPANEAVCPYSVTDVARHLGVTYPAVKKILDKGRA